MIRGVGFGVWGLRDEDLRFQGLGFRVQGSGFSVEGFMV